MVDGEVLWVFPDPLVACQRETELTEHTWNSGSTPSRGEPSVACRSGDNLNPCFYAAPLIVG